ncbi:MAG: hypothetical protein H6622_15505 [Halobacteriovoraceae bacterium]|nr:hypothetical protein [Halobacteriovoraceae bacterium]
MRTARAITFIVFLLSIHCSKGYAQSRLRRCKRAIKSLLEFKISRPVVVTDEYFDITLTPQETWTEDAIRRTLYRSTQKTYDFHKRQLNFMERFLADKGVKFDMEDSSLYRLLEKQLYKLEGRSDITPYTMKSYLKFVRNLPARHRHRAIRELDHLADHTGKYIYNDFTNLILDMMEFFTPSHSSKHIRHFHSIQNRLRTYQYKEFSRLERKYLRKGMNLLEAREKAAKNSFQIRKAYERNIHQCRAPKHNESHQNAKNKHRWVAISSGAAFTGMAYAWAHRNDESSSQRWWSLFSYEVSAKIAAQFIMSSIMSNPTGSLFAKSVKKYFASRGVGAVETLTYNNFMADKSKFDTQLKELLADEDRVDQIKEMAKEFSPDREGRSIQEFKEKTGFGYISPDMREDYRSETEIYREIISEIETRYGEDAMKKFNDFYHDKHGASTARMRLIKDQSKDVPMATNVQWDNLTDEDLKEPFVQAIVGSLLINKMYEQEKGKIESLSMGDKGVDRFIFFAVADALQIFKDPLIDNYMYMTVCMAGQFEPAVAKLKARMAYFGNKIATEFLFYSIRKHAINM